MSRLIHKSIFLLSFFISGCMPSGAVVNAAEPDWIRGESAYYPNAQYVVASGSASDAETAQKRAQANLSKVFELRIRESATTTQDVSSQKVDGVESVQSTQRIDSKINVSTSKIIEGARIAEQWQNPDDRTHYALAVLDRHQAGNNIRAEMEKLDNETAFELERSQAETDTLLKVAALQSVLTAQQEREALQKTLKVIDLSGRGLEARWSRAELRNRLQQALNALEMRAVVGHDTVGGLESILRGAMAKAGFIATRDAGGYRLGLDVVTQPAFMQQNWHWQRATLDLRLEAPDGSVRGQKSWPLKVSASQPTQLSARLRASIEKKLNAELASTVLSFAVTN
jgi:hypothetical protein